MDVEDEMRQGLFVVGKRQVNIGTDKLTLLSLIMALQLPGQQVLLSISPVYCSAFTEIENSNDGFLKFEHM